jgi:sporulation protein YlmC with PRC-barrel domain
MRLDNRQFGFLLAITCSVMAAPVSGHSSRFADTTSYNGDTPCREVSGPLDLESLKRARESAVFAVYVTRGSSLQPNGTATLVDDSGILLTAAHVVHFDKDKLIEITKVVDGAKPVVLRYPVRVISDTKDWLKSDLALLQADNWDNPPILSVPFRFNALSFIDGFFVGHAEGMKGIVFQPFTHRFGSTDDSDGMPYRGTVFPHASGALLLDERGRAFAMALRHSDFSGTAISDLTIEGLFRILTKRDAFSAFPLQTALGLIKSIPPSGVAKDLISRAQRAIIDDWFVLTLERRALSSVDLIHVTDALFTEPGWDNVRHSRQHFRDLMSTMSALAAKLCAHHYFWDRFSVAQDNATSHTQATSRGAARSVGAAATGADTGPQIMEKAPDPVTPNLPAQLPDAEVGSEPFTPNDPREQGRLGTLLLERALANLNTRDRIATRQIKLAKGYLDRATEDPAVQVSLAARVRSREHAALFANLALAEDLGATRGIGTRSAAERAIRASDALGGSPTAYQLAAAYAAEDGQPEVAAGILARAVAMLSDEKPGDQPLRASLKKDFASISAGRTALADTRIETYRVSPELVQANGRWTAMAAAAAPPSTTPALQFAGSNLSRLLSSPNAGQLFASTLIGTTAVGSSSETIGNVSDVILDRNGRVNALVISVGGFLGIGGKDIAVPLELVEAQARGMPTSGWFHAKPARTSAPAVAMQSDDQKPGASAGAPNNVPVSSQVDRVVVRLTKRELQDAPSFKSLYGMNDSSTAASSGLSGMTGHSGP